MYNILLVEEAEHSEQLDGEVTDVGQRSGLTDLPLVIVGVQWCGAQVLKHQAVVWPIEKLVLRRHARLGLGGDWLLHTFHYSNQAKFLPPICTAQCNFLIFLK